MDGLRIGVMLPHTGRAAGPGALAAVAVAAEQLGFDGVWAGDHVLLPVEAGSDYPYRGEDDAFDLQADRPFMEPLASLAYVAALTERVRLGTSVAVAPLRHPALWAKSIGTLWALTEGRLALGFGAGWLSDEFDALGLDYARRGEITDETLAFLRRAWSADGPVTFAGRRFPLPEPMHLEPGAGLDPAPRLLIGGNGKPSLRRTAAYGDDWHPHVRGVDPERLAAGLDAIRSQAEDAGRGLEPGAVVHCPLLLADAPGEPPWVTGHLEGPPAHVRAVLADYRDAGLTEAVLTFGGGPDRRVETMRRLAEALL